MDQHVRIILGHVFNNEQLHLLSRIGARRPQSWSVRCVSQPERDDISHRGGDRPRIHGRYGRSDWTTTRVHGFVRPNDLCQRGGLPSKHHTPLSWYFVCSRVLVHQVGSYNHVHGSGLVKILTDNSTGSNYIRSYRRYRRIQRQRRLCRRLSQPACFHPPTNTPHLPPVNIHHSTGKFLDWNYRHTSSRFQATTNETDIFPPRKKPPSAASTSSSSSAPSAP